MNFPVICIVGPTASGKSEVAQCVAEQIGAEIISADSMQVYRGMNIGTGKVLAQDRRVPHYGLDIVNPGEAYSAALFQAYARDVLNDIDSRGQYGILCGGTGLYVRAVIDDYSFPKGEQTDNAVRDFYTNYCERFGSQALWNELDRKDPQSAALIHPHNTRRVIRAFELLADGTTYAKQHEHLASIEEFYPALQFGLEVDVEALNERINNRVVHMVEDGLLEEVSTLLANGFREGITSPQAIGYKEIVDYFEDRCTLSEAIASIQTATRRYAKRQRTWFRKDKRIYWVPATERNPDSIADEVVSRLETST